MISLHHITLLSSIDHSPIFPDKLHGCHLQHQQSSQAEGADRAAADGGHGLSTGSARGGSRARARSRASLGAGARARARARAGGSAAAIAAIVRAGCLSSTRARAGVGASHGHHGGRAVDASGASARTGGLHHC